MPDDEPSYDEHPLDTPRDRAASVGTPFRRRKGGTARGPARVVVIVLVVLLGLGLLGGGFWAWNAQGGSGGDQYLAGATVSSLIDKVKQQGFECIPGRTIAQCEKEITGASLGITLHFDDETEVRRIEASGGTAEHSDDKASTEELRAFFEMAASLPPLEDDGMLGKARSWVRDTVGESGTATFGGVRYESAGDQQLLTMRPA